MQRTTINPAQSHHTTSNKRFYGIHGKHIPSLQVRQLAAVISSYYAIRCVCIYTIDMIYGIRSNIGQAMHVDVLDAYSDRCWSSLIGLVLVTPAIACRLCFYLVVFGFLVEKSNRVADMAVTLWGVDLGVRMVYSMDLPSLHGLAITAAIHVLYYWAGVYVCGKLESMTIHVADDVIDTKAMP